MTRLAFGGAAADRIAWVNRRRSIGDRLALKNQETLTRWDFKLSVGYLKPTGRSLLCSSHIGATNVKMLKLYFFKSFFVFIGNHLWQKWNYEVIKDSIIFYNQEVVN